MSNPTLLMIIFGCIVTAALVHEMQNDRPSLAYELLFWVFISLTTYFLLLSALRSI